LENDFKVTPQQLEAAITPKTKLIMYSSPSNPTGMLYTKEELKAIADVLARNKHVFVMADEIYEHINFHGKHESLAQFDEIKDQVITVNGVAKGFAMTGWRIGFIGAALPIAKACDKLQGQVTSATCSIAQRAAIKAMEMNPETSTDIISMREKFKERRNLMYKLLQEIPGLKTRLPQGAFYFFPEINTYFGKKYDKYTINDSNDLSMYLLYEANVALVPGAAFGDDNCIRFSYAASENVLIEAVKRIKEALAKLK
jgi:aspartate aminotransferase